MRFVRRLPQPRRLMREGSPRRHRPYLCADEIGFERYCRGLSSFSQFLEVKPDCAESAPTRRAFLASGGRRPRYASGEPAQLGPSILFLVVQWRGGRKGRERESRCAVHFLKPRSPAPGPWLCARPEFGHSPKRGYADSRCGQLAKSHPAILTSQSGRRDLCTVAERKNTASALQPPTPL